MKRSLDSMPRRLQGVFLLLLLVVLANYNIVFLGQSLVASANYHPFDYRFTHMRPGEFTGTYSFVNWHDLGSAWWQWEPAAVAFSKHFRSGHIPLWDPSLAGGVDTHVGLVQGQYYPPHIALVLAGNTPLMRDLYYLAQVFLSGLFLYLLLRGNGVSTAGALAGGAAYMLGGTMTQNVNTILGQSYAVLPGMAWAVDRALRKGTWRTTAEAALLLAVFGLSSFLPIVISGYVVAGLLVGTHAAMKLRKRHSGERRLVEAALPFAMGAAAILVSAALLGFLLWPVHRASIADQVFATWYPGIGLQHFSPDRLLTLLSPSISFDVWQVQNKSTQLFRDGEHGGGLFYTGVIPVLLAPFAFSRRSASLRLLVFFSSVVAFVGLKVLGVPPIQWLGYLPVFKNLHFVPYFSGAIAFGIAGLAGLGVDRIVRRREASAAPVAVIGTAVVFIVVLRFAQSTAINPNLQGGALWGAISRYAMEVTRMGIVSAVLIAIVVFRSRMRNSSAVGALLVAAIAIDLIPLGARQRFLRADVWSNPPEYVRFLQRETGLFRVHGTHDLAVTANVSQAWGIPVISSRLSFHSSRFWNLVRTHFETRSTPYPVVSSLLPTTGRTVLDVLGVKFVVAFAEKPEELEPLLAAGLVPRLQDGLFHVLENRSAWPRAYVANAVRVVPDPGASLAALPSLRPGEAVIEAGSGAAAEGVVESMRHDGDEVWLRVRASGPTVLVLGENFSPGWSATVGGRPAVIRPANHTFQAVEIPAGVSEVRFRYRTPGLLPGVALSSAGMLALCGLVYLDRRRQRQAREAGVATVHAA